MESERVRILLRAPPVEHGRQVGAAAEPGFRCDDKARVHVHGRHVRVLRMRDERDARGPEARVVIGAGDLLGELGREGAVDGGGMHADLLEDAAMHQAHGAAATVGARVIGALPGRALEAAGRPIGKECGSWQVVLDPLEGRADVVAQPARTRRGPWLGGRAADRSRRRAWAWRRSRASVDLRGSIARPGRGASGWRPSRFLGLDDGLGFDLAPPCEPGLDLGQPGRLALAQLEIMSLLVSRRKARCRSHPALSSRATVPGTHFASWLRKWRDRVRRRAASARKAFRSLVPQLVHVHRNRMAHAVEWVPGTKARDDRSGRGNAESLTSSVFVLPPFILPPIKNADPKSHIGRDRARALSAMPCSAGSRST